MSNEKSTSHCGIKSTFMERVAKRYVHGGRVSRFYYEMAMTRRGLFGSQYGVEPTLEAEEEMLPFDEDEPEEVEMEEVPERMWLPYLRCDEKILFVNPEGRVLGRGPRPGDVFRSMGADGSAANWHMQDVCQLFGTEGANSSSKDSKRA